MPQALAIGVPFEIFWSLNPRKLKPFYEAYRLRIKDQNQMFYIQGQYTLSALMATVGNLFLKKGHKPNEYPKEPLDIFAEKRLVIEENMTDEQKKKETEKLFGMLAGMQEKFEKHKDLG